MLGQGRPKLRRLEKSRVLFSNAKYRKHKFGFGFVAALIGLLFIPAPTWGQSSDASNDPVSILQQAPTAANSSKSVRVRISWGGGGEKAWYGTVKVAGRGSLVGCHSLALTSDSPGAIRLQNGEVQIRQPSATNYGGFEVTFNGFDQTELNFELTSSDQTETFNRKFTLASLLNETISVPIDDRQNRLTLARAPGDQLRVEVDGDSLVFAPSETLALSIQPNLTGIASRKANLRMKMTPARRRSPLVWSESVEIELDSTGTSQLAAYEIPVPSEEGVYDLLLEVEPIWYQAPFNNRKSTVQRRVQFVVVGRNRPATGPEKPWKEFLTLDPSNGRILTQSPNASLLQLNRIIVAANRRPLGNDRFRIDTATQGFAGSLEVGGWHAIQIPIQKKGMPHLIEFEFDGSSPMALGVSILEPDATGQIPTVGFDSGIVVPDTIVSGNKGQERLVHRQIIWPNTDATYLLLANRHSQNPATIGNIRISTGPRSQIAAPKTAAPENRMSSTGEDVSNREFMAFYEMPLFAENFGAAEVTDEVVQQPLDDWMTFYTGAQRFIDYLNAHHYSGAYITVAIDGSSIYPSELLAPTPKFDSGIFAFDGQDPIRKDILEMLFRMFDQANLKLVPVLAFTSPLPEIETTRANQTAEQQSTAGLANDFDLVNFRQQPRSSRNEQLPIYNPLSVRVQSAVRRVVAELAERYRQHDAFQGVAISCRPDTYTQLAGVQWSYDSTTVNRFRAAVQSDLPYDQFFNQLLGERKQEWIDWRANKMQEWYIDLLRVIQNAKPNAKLVLAPTDLLQSEEASSTLSPSLHQSPDFNQTMLHFGFSKSLLTVDPNLVLLSPHRFAPNQSLATERINVHAASLSQTRDFFDQGVFRGTLFFNRVSWAHFSEFQKQNNSQSQAAPLVRLQPLTPAGAENRQRFAKSLRENDSNTLIDGGILLSTGQEQYVHDFRKVYGALPNVRMADAPCKNLPADQNPIAVRSVQLGDQWHFYAVNNSPWPIRCAVKFKSNTQANIQSVSDTSLEIAATPESGLAEIRFDLEPFGLVGGQANATINIQEFSIQFPNNSDQPLRQQLQVLQSKLAQASKAIPIEVIKNPSFQVGKDPSLQHWDFGDQPTSNVNIEEGRGHNDKSSLRLFTDGKPVWIRSSPFQAPQTGRLSVSVWVRTDNPEEQPPIRLALEGQTSNTDYYRFGSIGGLAPASTRKRVDSNWQRFAVHFDDLPVQGIENLRIGFDLMGPGEIWIDNIEIYDRWFDSNDTKAITQMLATAGLLLSKAENVDQSRIILRRYWPRFLDEYFSDAPKLPAANDQQTNQGNSPRSRISDSSPASNQR